MCYGCSTALLWERATKVHGHKFKLADPSTWREPCHFRGRPQVGKIQIQHWQQLHFRLAAAHPMQILRIAVSGKRTTKVPQTYVVVGLEEMPSLEQTWRCYEGLPLTIGTDSPSGYIGLDTLRSPSFQPSWQNVGATSCRCSVGGCGWLEIVRITLCPGKSNRQI